MLARLPGRVLVLLIATLDLGSGALPHDVSDNLFGWRPKHCSEVDGQKVSVSPKHEAMLEWLKAKGNEQGVVSPLLFPTIDLLVGAGKAGANLEHKKVEDDDSDDTVSEDGEEDSSDPKGERAPGSASGTENTKDEIGFLEEEE